MRKPRSKEAGPTLNLVNKEKNIVSSCLQNIYLNSNIIIPIYFFE